MPDDREALRAQLHEVIDRAVDAGIDVRSVAAHRVVAPAPGDVGVRRELTGRRILVLGWSEEPPRAR